MKISNSEDCVCVSRFMVWLFIVSVITNIAYSALSIYVNLSILK